MSELIRKDDVIATLARISGIGNRALDKIKALPAVDPTPHGWWMTLERGEHGYSSGDFKCSVCGGPNRCYSLTKYCANCGALMREDKQ